MRLLWVCYEGFTGGGNWQPRCVPYCSLSSFLSCNRLLADRRAGTVDAFAGGLLAAEGRTRGLRRAADEGLNGTKTSGAFLCLLLCSAVSRSSVCLLLVSSHFKMLQESGRVRE